MESQKSRDGGKKFQRKKHLCDVLMRNGFKYTWIVDGEGNVIAKIPNHLIPRDRAHDIMAAFSEWVEGNSKKSFGEDSPNESHKAMFDKAVAELINKGTEFLKTGLVAAPELAKQYSHLVAEPGAGARPAAIEIPQCAEFWVALKEATLMEDVDEDTVYLFVLKLCQGREAWKESLRGADLQELDQLKRDLQSKNKPYTADHLTQMQNDQVKKRTQFQGRTARAIDAFTSTIQALATINPAVGSFLEKQYCGNTLAGMVEELAYEADNQQEDDGLVDDDELLVLEDLVGIDARELVRVGTIEQEDAFYAFRMETWDPKILYRLDKPTWFKTVCGKEWIAKRAPYIDSLLDGTRLPLMWYETQLERRLRKYYEVDLDQRKANYAKALAAREMEEKELTKEFQAQCDREKAAAEAERDSLLAQGTGNLSLGDPDNMDCEMD